MRKTIRAKLLSKVPSLTDVYEPDTATAESITPYAVVKVIGEGESTITNAFNRDIEVWVYSNTSYAVLDAVMEQVIAALHEEMTTESGTVFGLRCYRISPDGFTDPELKARSKTATFIQYLVRK